MRLTLIAVVLFLGCTAVAGAQPQDGRVRAFQEICSTPGALHRIEEAALGLGWAVAGAEEGAPLARLTRMTAQTIPGVELRVLRREVENGGYFLLLSEARMPQFMMYTCSIYDLEATEAPDPNSVASWLGSDPVHQEGGGSSRYDWMQPTSLPRVFSIKLGWVAPGSDVAEIVGYSGYSLGMEGVGPLPH